MGEVACITVGFVSEIRTDVSDGKDVDLEWSDDSVMSTMVCSLTRDVVSTVVAEFKSDMVIATDTVVWFYVLNNKMSSIEMSKVVPDDFYTCFDEICSVCVAWEVRVTVDCVRKYGGFAV